MMPGSSASPSDATSKAKVTSATTNGGIFVRPVAVAGIFCPANESDAKPPALPEKRRFSALVGDLRPCSSDNGALNDDFNRRRQSWDTRQKDVPFGQSLLRKTPKNNPVPAVRSVISEVTTNGSIASGGVAENSTGNTSIQTSDALKVKDSSKIGKEVLVSSISENKSAKCTNVGSKIQDDLPKINCDTKLNFEKSVNKSAIENKSKDIINPSSIPAVKSSSNVGEKTNLKDSVNITDVKSTLSVENTKQSKKVYGLFKRDSKPEICDVQNNNSLGNKTVIPNVTKTKVYGVNKTNLKKDSETFVQDSQTKAEPEICIPSKIVPQKASESINSNESLPQKKVNEPTISPPKEFRTVRRTSDVIAAKIQNMFSNFQPEKSIPFASRKSQILEKTGAPVELKKSSEKVEIGISQPQNVKSNQNGSSTSISDRRSLEKQKGNKLVESEVSKTNVSLEQNVKAQTKDLSSDKNFASSCNSTTIRLPAVKNKNDVFNKESLDKQGNGIANIQNLKVDYLHTSAASKTEHSVNVLSSKQPDKKLADIGGKMPTKKADHNNSCDANAPLIATAGKADHKSSDLSLSTSMASANMGLGQQRVAVVNNIPNSALAKNTACHFSVLKVVNQTGSKGDKILGAADKKLESHLHPKESHNSSSVTQSFVSTSSTQKTSYSTSSSSSITTSNTEIHKTEESSKSVLNLNTETTEVSKLEITKITPSTIPGIVPTVNVLFRTKSPQGVANRDENRRKVVIETFSNDTPISSAVINPSLPAKSSSSCKVTDSVKEAFKTVADVQNSLNTSPIVPRKHSIVNLKNEEVVTVTLSPNLNTPEPPSPSNTLNGVRSKHSTSYFDLKTPIATNKTISESQTVFNAGEPESNCTFSSSMDYKGLASKRGFEVELGKNISDQTKMTVVDLGDWSKKFQSHEPEAPRAPLRRRALRDSLPPSLPLRSISRYGSLKRIEDAPRYIPRSPSQSSLPQRYSYTEMLSKVCSMGVLPYVEPMNSKSCSSSSSQVSELWSELSEEQSTATHASEMLEAETSERMRLEKEVHELQGRYSQVQQRSDKMEMEMMETRMYRSPEINGDLSEDDETDGSSSLYKQKYERAVRDIEIMKRRMMQQQEEETEQKAMMKKASEKRLAEALEDVEEERQIANQWKRKAQKLGAELQDLRLMLEEQMGRNGELEKKQRRFDAELSAVQEEIKKEKLLKEKLMREKDQAISEKYSLEQDLQTTKLDSDMLHEKITQLNRELDELTLSSKGEEEVTQLKRTKQELERKTRDQEEELEELAAQVQMLEQAKLRLEMSLEKVRQEHRREASVREEEIEEIRASFSKKIKNLEAQLESEQDERHQLMKQKHELERRIYELADQPPPQDPEIERRLRRDLKRTKALLRDAQSMLEHTREGQSSKTLIRQLKNQLEDSEFAKATAVKARQAIETELQECQSQLEEVTRTKNEAESRCLQLSREKSGIQTQLEEAEEEMAEVMKKYKAVVAQMSIDQKALAEQNQQIADLETERQMLKDQLSEVSHKFEHLSGQSDDTHKVHWLDSKIRDLESKLELEQTTKTRLENQIARLKEQNDRSREECDSLRNKEMQAQEGIRRVQRQLRDMREDYSALQQKESDAYRKQHELEMALENTETDLQVTKNDLRLACQRIQDLQNALEDDLDSGTDVPDESGSESDDSFELSLLRNQSITPVQRCDSVASNLSYCTTEEQRSRASSFSRELSAFSSRDDVEKDINGFSGVNDSRGLNLENDEAI